MLDSASKFKVDQENNIVVGVQENYCHICFYNELKKKGMENYRDIQKSLEGKHEGKLLLEIPGAKDVTTGVAPIKICSDCAKRIFQAITSKEKTDGEET